MTTRNLKATLSLAGVFFGLLFGLFFAGVGTASAQSNVLWTNQSMHPGQYLLSQSGRYQFIFQTDGNVVLYDLWNGHRALWASNTVNRRGFWSTRSDTLTMQGDGNLVLYGYYINSLTYDIWHVPGQPVQRSAFWASNSNDNTWVQYRADPTLVVQNDGNVVIYVYPLTARISPIWATNTWSR